MSSFARAVIAFVEKTFLWEVDGAGIGTPFFLRRERMEQLAIDESIGDSQLMTGSFLL